MPHEATRVVRAAASCLGRERGREERRVLRPLPRPLDRFVLVLLPEPTAVAHARRVTVRTLERWGLDERAGDASVVVSELAGNAFRHGRAPVRLVLRCEPSAAGPAAACMVCDAGRWTGGVIPDREAVEAAWCAEGGRGLYIARELSDSLIVRAGRYRPGTVVTATFKIRGPGRGTPAVGGS